jgi:hypothetical protein
MYTDADEGAAPENQIPLENYQPLTQSTSVSLECRPGYQSLSRKRAEDGNGIDTVLDKMRRLLLKQGSNPSMQALKGNGSPSVELDVGGMVYSEPYEDSVSAGVELRKGSESFRAKRNTNLVPDEGNKLVYYHVLEDPDDSKSTGSPTTCKNIPVKPLPFTRKEQSRDDVYYYCDSDSPDSKPCKTTSTKSLQLVPKQQPVDDVYYSCAVEDSSNKRNRANSKKASISLPYDTKEKSPKTSEKNASGVSANQQQAYYHVLETQSERSKPEPTSKNALKPMNSKPMLNAHVIQEMKSRVANKKSGN